MSYFHLKKRLLIILLSFLSLFSLYAESEAEEGAETSDNELELVFKPSNPFNAILFLKDILNDKYPFRIDFGAEPHRHGSLVFGSLWYDWNSVISSSIRGEYDHYITFLNTEDAVTTTEVHSVSLIPFPLVLFFGNPDINAKSIFTEIDSGFYIQNSYSSITDGSYQNYSEDGFELLETDSKYIMVGPAFNIVLKVPVVKYIDTISEFFFVPVYALAYDSDTFVHNLKHSSSSSVSGIDVSSPYLKYSLCLDFLRYLRLKSQITYQHINRRQSISETEKDVNYSEHKLIVRYGGELLTPSKTRKKSSHLWGGLYYELTWDWIYSGSMSSKENTGKWVLCFGT